MIGNNNETTSELPENWVWTTIGEVVNRERVRVDPQDYPDLPYIGMEDVESETMRLLGTRPASEMKSSAEYFRPDDVLYGRLRPYLNKVYRPDFEGLGSAEFIVFRRVPHLESKYLQYFLNQWSFVAFINRQNTGDRPRVKFSQMADYPFPLAPRNEQKRIVDEIEKQFTRLDAAVANLKRIQANLERYKAAVLKAACEGRLVPQEADLNPDYEPAEKLLERILEERRRRWEEEAWQKQVERAKKKVEQARRKAAGLPYYFRDMEPEDWMDVPEEEYREYLPKSDKWKEKYEEPEPPDTDDLPELPEGWVWATVEQIGDVRLGRQRAPKHHDGPYMRPYLRAANATWDGVDLTDVMEMNFPPSDFETYRLEQGDILLNEASGSQDEVGKPFIWENQIPECCFQNTLIRVRLFSLPPDFIYYHFRKDARTGRFGEVAKGVGIFHLGATRLASIPLAIPPLDEQTRIVAELERRLTLLQAAEDALNANSQRATRLRQAILQGAFKGNLVPQDPNDEPASVLLARIRGKQEAAVKQPSLPFEGD